MWKTPQQADWDDIAEKLVHAINNSRDSTRQETSFYLVHGWDARSTLKAMTESIRQGQTSLAQTTDAAEWRREANRQREVAPYLAAELQPCGTCVRLKAVNELGERPTTRLRPELGEAGRIDFDEELLPEDSWEPDENEDKYEVEAILDDELPLSTSTVRAQRTFKVKWVGHDERSWEPLSNWSYGGLLFDYLRNKKRENRLKMAQVADEN
ncbi:unnamed protein product [Phytophthora fragariaefolia]|uniref:Unnamed protein product n=1 Tax=Phytophthora fragariaefolia TaxID=1490495 RepID=A0A9W6X030_9STRA|nr:unnamed protein product [Phytophthora fragariaefolia]